MSTSDGNDELQDPRPTKAKIDALAGDLLDFNQKVVLVIRAQIKDYEMLASFFEAQKQRCYAIIDHKNELMQIAVTNTGDILMAEFGSPFEDEDDDDDGE